MSALLASLLPYLLAAGAAIVTLLSVFASGRSAGKATQKAKEAETRAKNLDDVKRAQDAAARVRPDDGGVLNDPNNRDNRDNRR